MERKEKMDSPAEACIRKMAEEEVDKMIRDHIRMKYTERRCWHSSCEKRDRCIDEPTIYLNPWKCPDFQSFQKQQYSFNRGKMIARQIAEIEELKLGPAMRSELPATEVRLQSGLPCFNDRAYRYGWCGRGSRLHRRFVRMTLSIEFSETQLERIDEVLEFFVAVEDGNLLGYCMAETMEFALQSPLLYNMVNRFPDVLYRDRPLTECLSMDPSALRSDTEVKGYRKGFSAQC